MDAIGKGAGALWVLYAAALDGRIRAVVAERGLVSYASLTRVDRYLHGAGVFVRDVLTSFDLPHVAAAIADRSAGPGGPVNPMKEPVARWQAEHTASRGRCTLVRAPRAGLRSPGRNGGIEDLADQYLRLLG